MSVSAQSGGLRDVEHAWLREKIDPTGADPIEVRELRATEDRYIIGVSVALIGQVPSGNHVEIGYDLGFSAEHGNVDPGGFFFNQDEALSPYIMLGQLEHRADDTGGTAIEVKDEPRHTQDQVVFPSGYGVEWNEGDRLVFAFGVGGSTFNVKYQVNVWYVTV